MSVESVEVVTPTYTRHSFTVEEYRRMVEAGILREDARVELIGGEVVEMSPIGKRHAACVARLTQVITLLLQRAFLVWAQNPIQLDGYSEPQPDVVVLRPRDDFYENEPPKPEDILLVIEVSDSTLAYDRKVKVPLYARAGIPEVWIVNLVEERVETFADLSGGVYQTTAAFSRGEEVQSRSLAALRLGVSEIFG
ncbi:MAG TPA: Uma2 family endonuclease [Pyrinomonadaceae bacterium]|jgi:Uma2 family endonuclease|nr:Uma2 family endonuclease [Pyrinomonadaceae bacterium]